MAPSDLYAALLTQLTSVRSLMLSAEWQNALLNQPEDVRVMAGNELIRVQGAILTLSNESLSDIVGQMQANEPDLANAITGLKQALGNIQQVAGVLNAITKVVGVVAKIIPLV